MAQHDMNIANQGFPATRADLNNALQALVSNSSGTSAPSTTFANQWWYDTTNNKMYLRNEANNAWIEVAVLDQTNNEWQITTGVVQAKDSDGLALKTDDGTTRLFVKDSDGRIGIATSSPEGLFHVETTAGAVVINEGSSTSRYTTHLEVTDVGLDFHVKSTSRGIVFNNGTTKTQRMLMNADGDFAFGGVTSPATGFGSTFGMLDTGGSLLVRGAIAAHQTSAAVLQHLSDLSEIRSYGATSGSGEMRFMIGGGGGSSDTEAMRIDETGAVGIGDSNPNARLFVNFAANTSETSNPHFRIGGSGYSAFHFLDGSAYYIGQNSNSRALRMYSGSNEAAGVNLAAGGTSFGTYSDERLKYDVENVENAVETLSGLRTVKYRLKNVDEPDDKKKIGVIAQDLEGKLDEVIETIKISNDDTEYMGVRYTELVPVLIKAIQEQQETISSLEERISALENIQG